MRDEKLEIHLEKAVAGYPAGVAASLSIAISLKRIADFICGSESAEDVDVVQYVRQEFGQ
jgi:hypothetical protein